MSQPFSRLLRFLSRILTASGLPLVLLAGRASAQMVAEPLGEQVTRYFADRASAEAAAPSLALEKPQPFGGKTVEPGKSAPRFGSQDAWRVATVKVEAGTSLYGTGETSGPLLRNGRIVTCWNTDAYGYADPAPSLYQSHPWVLAVRADGTAFGVLADTTYRTEIDLTKDIVFRVQGPAFPVIVIERESPEKVVQALADLTGHIEMPPKWALGYHQCRYSYYPHSRVRESAMGFRDRKIPCDVIWMDIDYMDGFRCFTFSPKHFPDPAALNGFLHDNGFHSVWMIDPGIKAEPGYAVYDSGQRVEGGAWVQKADGSTYQGEVWPGMCVFPDFTREATRTWWASLYKGFMATGVDGVWNDMNEPAVFNVTSKTMPEDNLHRADVSLGGPGPHSRYHNVFGMQMVRATRDGMLAANPQKRPFVLSRANYLGGQRYAAMWTGDNTADWAHMEESIPMALNLGLSGQPFSGSDIGGFTGNGDGQLFARWMGIGTLLPFSRSHTEKGNIDKEPWAFGPDVEATCRRAIERRYRLMPYFYTLFWQAHTEGLPVVRPVFFADAKDTALRTEDDAFLVGRDVLVVPQLVPDRNRVLTLPKGYTALLPTGDSDDVDLPELRMREGSIVPMGPVMQHVDEKPLDPLTLVVSLDAQGQATGMLYEDAGDGWGFRDQEYAISHYTASLAGGTVTVRRASVDGKMKLPARRVEVRVLVGTQVYSGQGKDGKDITVAIPK